MSNKPDLNGLVRTMSSVARLGLTVRRELRASRSEKRAIRREERAEVNHLAKHEPTKYKEYFGRKVEVDD